MAKSILNSGVWLLTGLIAFGATAQAAPPVNDNTKINRVNRRAGALALVTVLTLLLAAPAARADTIYNLADEIATGCVPRFARTYVMDIPDLNFLGTFTEPSTLQHNVDGDNALLLAVIKSLSAGFKVEVHMSDKKSCVVPDIIPTDCETPSTYECFSSWSGTLEVVDHPISENLGAVYSLTGTGEFLFGDGAFIFHTMLGARGEFSLQLDDPARFPNLPADPLPGDLRFILTSAAAAIPRADESVIGTWDGTLDCVGQTGQTNLGSTNDTSSDATLLMAAGAAKLGETTYCVNLPASADGSTSEGLLASPETFDPKGFVKVDGDTLKLRLLRSAGHMDNIDFCKGEFTRTDPANPGVVVPTGCDTTGALLNNAEVEELCDTVICGPGTICENTELIADGGNGVVVRCRF